VTGTNSGAGTAHPSGAPEFTSGFKQGSCCSYCPITCPHVFNFVFWCLLRFMRKTVFGLSKLSFVL